MFSDSLTVWIGIYITVGIILFPIAGTIADEMKMSTRNQFGIATLFGFFWPIVLPTIVLIYCWIGFLAVTSTILKGIRNQ